MYKYGSLKEDLKLIKEAADKGHIKALYHYSQMLNEDEESDKYLKESAYKGRVESMYKYGLKLYRREKNVEEKEESIQFLKKASDKGQIESIYKYGEIIGMGDGVPIDKTKQFSIIKCQLN